MKDGEVSRLLSLIRLTKWAGKPLFWP